MTCVKKLNYFASLIVRKMLCIHIINPILPVDSMSEKRTINRFRKRLTIKFGIDGAHRVAFTEDISRTGICIKSAFVFNPGSKLVMELLMPDESIVNLKGVVVWAKRVPPNMIHLIKKAGMGIMFTKIENGKELFEKLIADIHPK